MHTSEQHNLDKASVHTREARTRLQTIRLNTATLLSTAEARKLEAYANHLEDMKEGIDEIKESVTERHKESTVPST